mmetsp:Transcript_13673/g.29778  ORF Transcript_13673/g.29778 Transcript_13673/m.29778 type:complete len:92 (+) Transcript_13673:155-430(+)
MSTGEQALLFNDADALIMIHGAQMANSIFAVDKTLFVELGCYIPTFIGNLEYMALVDGDHDAIQKCRPNTNENDICVVCDEDGDDTYGITD